MGHILYDGTTIVFDDRTLTHLQIVIVNKFVKGEAFLMSWRDDLAVGSGRSSAWLSPHLPLYFTFADGRVPAINSEWLHTLAMSAESPTGLIITGEDGRLALGESIRRKYPPDVKRRRTVR